MPVAPSSSSGFLVGIEIGGTKLQVVTGDDRGSIDRTFPFRVESARGAQGIREHIESAIRECRRLGTIQAVGVGFGGPMDLDRGEVTRSHQIEGWSGFPLVAWLRDLAGAPVAADNDANVATLAEARVGAGAGLDSVFYITLGSGVGGGLVSGGRIFHGAPPGEAEIGHLRLDRSGVLVEQRCSGWAVDARIRQEAPAHADSVLARLVREDPGAEARHLGKALSLGDAWAAGILEQVADDLGFALSHVVHLMHPRIILLGGGLSLVGDPFCARVRDVVKRHVMEVFRDEVAVGLGALREKAVPTGALILAGQVLSS